MCLGERFKVYIFVGNDRFLVAVNDKTFCSYVYRLPLSDVRTLEVTKDVQSIVQIDHRATFPVPCPTVLQDNSKFDFSNDIPRRFRPGKSREPEELCGEIAFNICMASAFRLSYIGCKQHSFGC